MERPAFRLQPLIQLREAARDQRRAELAQAYQAERILQEQMAQTQNDFARTRHAIHQFSEPGEINVDQLLDGHRYEMLLKMQHQEMQRQKEKLDGEIERRRQALVEADRELRILEKLRARKRAEQIEREQKLESSRLDEVALRRYQMP